MNWIFYIKILAVSGLILFIVFSWNVPQKDLIIALEPAVTGTEIISEENKIPEILKEVKIIKEVKIENLSAFISKCLNKDDFEKCLDGFIGPYLKTHKTSEVLAELNSLEQSNAQIRTQCHPIVHVIGRETFKKFGNISDSFAACDQTCHSGCYHGAMERFLRGDAIYSDNAEERAHINESEVKEKVISACDPNSPVNLRFQCLHGLGHAVVFFLDYKLTASLSYCDLLSSTWDRQSCWGGVFMENVTASDKSKRDLSKTDYHYPCDAINEQYRMDCYIMQTSRMFEMGLSRPKIIDECKKAGAYRTHCMQSLGRDLSNDARIADPKPVAALGESMEIEDKSPYMNGVIFALADNTWDGQYAFPFCEAFVSVEDKKNCFNIARSYMKSSLLRTADFLNNSCRQFVPKSDLCISQD